VAVAFRGEHLLAYAFNAEGIHQEGASVEHLLRRATNLDPIQDREIAPLPPDRQKVVQLVQRLVRDARFRDNVLGAYSYRCAVSGMQLNLLDAAHILPVGADGSSDEIVNGLALSPTYHRAFDRGLIYLDEAYRMRLNPRRLAELQEQNRHGGLEDFRNRVEKEIILPADNRHRPDRGMIRRANQFRGI